MKRVVLPCLFIAFLLFMPGLPCLASAQSASSTAGEAGTGAVTGIVQDLGGAALIGAKIVIQPTGRQAATDDQGQFRISNLPAGQYSITASYVGFAPYTGAVTVAAGQTATVNASLRVPSEADTVMVTAPRLQGDAEAVNVERMSANIVQVEPAGVITSLPNTNVADAIGRLPSVSLERDEGEGKYVQIRGTEPRLSNLTINGVNVPSVEVRVRNVKMDAIPANGIERIEVYKTLSADMDADGVGGTVNLVTPTAQDRPTYRLNGTAGYNPLQNGFWRGGFDGTFGRRWGAGKKYGFLLGGTWDRTNRGINDLEPSVTTGKNPANNKSIAYFSGEDLRSYDYYRTRYGFNSSLDIKFTRTMSAYVKGLFADFHDFGDTHVYTPNTGSINSVNGSQIVFDSQSTCSPAAQQAGSCSVGSWQYRHYIRRPDQQVFSFLSGARHDLAKDVIIYDFAVSRGHNIGGQDFPTTNFGGPGYLNSLNPGQTPGAAGVGFSEDISDPYRPKIFANDGTNGFDATQYSVYKSAVGNYHATQVNIQGSASLAHDYTVNSHPSTLSVGLKVRNSYSTQRENDTTLDGNSYPGPFGMAGVVGTYTNPTYYDGSFAVKGMAYGPTTSYDKIVKAVASSGGFTEETVNDSNTWYSSFFNADERITAGYVQDVIFVGPVRLEGGVRFDNGSTHFLAYSTETSSTATLKPCFKDPSQVICNPATANRQNASYFNALPSAVLQWQFQKDSNLRVVYSRGVARPNMSDLVPAVTKDSNQTPYPTVSTGNPNLVPTKSDNFDILAEHYFQPLGILQAGYFYKNLTDPIYPVANLIYYNGTQTCSQGSVGCQQWQATLSINGPNAHIQGVEMQWEQRFSFLPSMLGGFGVNANYSHTVSQVTFPSGFDGGRTDQPSLDRTSPNDYNFNLTYDKSRFSGRFAISHNDQSIASYGWNATSGPDPALPPPGPSDPIFGLKGPLGDNYFYPHTQFDVQGSFRLHKGLQVVGSGLNLSNEPFGFYNGSPIYPVQREYYRPTVSFGLRWSQTSEE